MQESPAEYLVRYNGVEYRLTERPLIVGRSDSCGLILRDARISRIHAKLVLEAGKPVIEDLGSQNGVLVNGERIDNARALAPGDIVVIGSERIQIERRSGLGSRPKVPRPDADTQRPSSFEPATGPVRALTDDGPVSSSEPTRSSDMIELLAGVAAKLAASGQVREAEQLLASRLEHVLKCAKAGDPIAPQQARVAAQAAVTLAEVTDDPKWIDYVFELLRVTDSVIEAILVERIHTIVRSIRRSRVELLRDYLEHLDARSLRPAERFVVQRLRGLEAVARTR